MKIMSTTLLVSIAMIAALVEGRTLLSATSHFLLRVKLPRKSTTSEVKESIVPALVSDGIPADVVSQDLCGVLGNFFETQYEGYIEHCPALLEEEIIIARGHSSLFEPAYSAAVSRLHQQLTADETISPSQEPHTYLGVWAQPTLYKIVSLALQYHLGAGGGVCLGGFGYGHLALAGLLHSSNGVVSAFDTGTDGRIVSAHDFLDKEFPDRLYLYGGNPWRIYEMGDVVPNTRCDVSFIDATLDLDTFEQAWKTLRALASSEQIVVVYNLEKHTFAWNFLVAQKKATKFEWSSTVKAEHGLVVVGRSISRAQVFSDNADAQQVDVKAAGNIRPVDSPTQPAAQATDNNNRKAQQIKLGRPR